MCPDAWPSLCTALHWWLSGPQVWPIWEAGRIENKLPPWQEEEVQRQRLSKQQHLSKQQRLGGGQQQQGPQAQQPPPR